VKPTYRVSYGLSKLNPCSQPYEQLTVPGRTFYLSDVTRS